MKSKSHSSRGFTLIELLVVIAIIGVLSSVVLASLNTARFKGDNAAVQLNMGGIQKQAALYFNENNNYGTNPLLESSCAATDNVFNDATVKNQIAGILKVNNGGSIVCNVAAGGMAYAVSAALISTPATYFCVDSAGMGTTTTTALGSGTNC